jgi:type II protein arginine methyltransferase
MHPRVLKIGMCSPALLSLLASSCCPAAQIWEIESSKTLNETAANILNDNKCKNVTLLSKKVSDVSTSDLPERADLLITDSLDYGLIGEGILPSFIHARDHLLKGESESKLF